MVSAEPAAAAKKKNGRVEETVGILQARKYVN